MAISWNGVLTALIGDSADAYEKRVQNVIVFAGLVVFGLIVFWKAWK